MYIWGCFLKAAYFMRDVNPSFSPVFGWHSWRTPVFNYRANNKWIQQMKHIGRYEWNHSVLRANCAQWAECTLLSSLQCARKTRLELRWAKEQSVTNQPGCHCWSNLPGVSPVCWNKVSGLTHCQISSMWHFQWSTKRKLLEFTPFSWQHVTTD